MSTATDTTIAALRASGQVEGQVSITGTVTTLDLRHTGAGRPWLQLTMTDASGGQLPVIVFPKLYPSVQQHLAEHAEVRVTGRINQGRTQLAIYAETVEPNPDLPDWE